MKVWDSQCIQCFIDEEMKNRREGSETINKEEKGELVWQEMTKWRLGINFLFNATIEPGKLQIK